MKIVLSAGSTSFALQEAACLAQKLAPHVVGVVIEDRSSLRFQLRALAERLRRYGPAQTLNQLLLVVYRRLAAAPAASDAPSADPNLLQQWDVLRIPSVNDPAVADFLRRKQTDLLLNLSTGIMHRPTFSVPRLGVINIHAGLNPKYRGPDPNFWAIHENDFQWLGTTLHWINEGVDTGGILYRKILDLQPADTIESLTSRSFHQGILATVDLVEHYQRTGDWNLPGDDLPSTAESKLHGWYGLTAYLRGRRNLARHLARKIADGVPENPRHPQGA